VELVEKKRQTWLKNSWQGLQKGNFKAVPTLLWKNSTEKLVEEFKFYNRFPR
jgi:hypothetical protein